MHRRVFTVLLIATLLIGSVFAGGGKESAASSADDNKLVVAIQTHSMVSDYDDNYLTKYIEDLTGIDIEFYELPPAKADVRTNVSLLAASSDDLPDVLLTDALTPETILSYGESGVFVPLDDYVDDAELLPNFNAIPALKFLRPQTNSRKSSSLSVITIRMEMESRMSLACMGIRESMVRTRLLLS